MSLILSVFPPNTSFIVILIFVSQVTRKTVVDSVDVADNHRCLRRGLGYKTHFADDALFTLLILI